MNATKATAAPSSSKAPAWVGELRKDLQAALRRIEEVENDKRQQLDVIQELQRQYQALLEAAARDQAKSASASGASAEIVRLHALLEKLTIKRHAVLTATLGGVGYQELTAITGWDVTTVKLQLRAALQILGIPSREALLVQHRRMLDSISDAEYSRRYGVSKRWWLERNDDLMDVLRTVKPAANQHMSAAAKRKAARRTT